MDLNQLRSFVAVAEEGHLTRAGERLHLSQSALSGQIKALEEELGLSLFRRTPRGMQLTDAGARLMARAGAVLDASRAVFEEAAHLRGEVTGNVRIGLNTDAPFLRVLHLQEDLARRHPCLSPEFVQSQSVTTSEALRHGDLDCGFCFGDRADEGIHKELMARVEIVAVGPAAWRDRIEGAGVAELAALPWLWTTSDYCPCYVDGEALFRAHGVCPNTVLRSDTEDVLRELVVAGRGMAFLRRDMADALLAEGSATAWQSGPPLSVSLHLAFLARRGADAVIAAVAGSARAVWRTSAACCREAVSMNEAVMVSSPA
ncbi:transcriptional regulator, LysR family [Desulfovibrio sp. X2]|uniref:LysR family transcriptional regulator n=1 Tax=Desulfovibrio sp. X2 TaxID=941449 RepID=UPI000358A035|nr:LysR family transcriptional regulator [Desulfovibrio sp. X2]EPR41667.1 transcriptional regulator, LysR family [Desulfovibrio sp. X2]